MSVLLCTLDGVGVTQEDDGRVHFVADADIDADGSPHAYNSRPQLGLDDLANAGRQGNWWGIATNRHGMPFIQLPTDPAPGFYVSTTAYKWPGLPTYNPKKYVDSETVPFIVVENFIRRRAKGIVLGCKAKITNTLTDQSVDAVVADIGPLYKIGEISIAAAKAIGVPWNARSGGISTKTILYELWPGTAAVVDDVVYRLIPALPTVVEEAA